MTQGQRDPWYREGLRFACTRCGRCCRGPGNVWVDDREIQTLAARVGEREDDFRRNHARRAGKRGWVLRQKRNQDCIFWLEQGGCSVYEDRPRQCRTYPFWQANLTTPSDWEYEGRACPGIGDGPLHRLEAIEAARTNDGIPEHRTRRRRERETG